MLKHFLYFIRFECKKLKKEERNLEFIQSENDSMLLEDQLEGRKSVFKQIVGSLGNSQIRKAPFSSVNGSGQRQGVPLGPHAFTQINAIFI